MTQGGWLCYAGLACAMDNRLITRAGCRPRYGTDLPEASVPARFLEEVPIQWIEELGGRRPGTARVGTGTPARPAGRSPAHDTNTHYSYEDEDQSVNWRRASATTNRQKPTTPAKPYTSTEKIA